MSKEQTIEVWPTPRSDRGIFVLRWRDPITGKVRQRKTDIAVTATEGKAFEKAMGLAKKAAGALEERLNSPIPINEDTGNAWSWDQFCVEYRKVIADTSQSNRDKWKVVASEVDEVFKANRTKTAMLAHIDANFVDKVRDRLITHRKNASTTADSSIATLRSGLNYAASKGWMPPVPAPLTRGRKEADDKEMRGRPITGEEFERIVGLVGAADERLTHVEKKVADKVRRTRADPDSWRRILNGIWLSGMRISEALEFHVDRRDCHRPLALDTNRPKVVFHCGQKNRKTQVVAMTSPFANYLRSIQPDGDGFYFCPTGPKGRYTTPKAVGKIIAAIGQVAGVLTDPGEFASAHDMRRGFARIWSGRVMPPVLMHLMRHRSLDTTMKYYVGSDADAAAVAMYDTWEKQQEPMVSTSDEIHESLSSL